jgi:UDP-glucose 4-epimerase
MNAAWQEWYHRRTVLVFGGAGFIGSHIVERLVACEAQVTVVDALVPGSGGRRENLHTVAGDIRFLLSDYGQVEQWLPMLEPGAVIFHCAAVNTHRWCNEHPDEDARWNYLPNCAVAAALRRLPHPVRLLYASTRTVYAPSRARAVTEHHRILPADIYSLHCWASERVLLSLNAVGHSVAVLRLPHVYGPRQRLEGVEIGFLGEVLRAALRGEPYELHANGEVHRDVLYVGDAAEAFLRLGCTGATGVFNVPGAYVSARTLAHILENITGWRAYRLVPTPASSFPPLSGKRLARALGWLPATPVAEGMRLTLQALRQ